MKVSYALGDFIEVIINGKGKFKELNLTKNEIPFEVNNEGEDGIHFLYTKSDSKLLEQNEMWVDVKDFRNIIDKNNHKKTDASEAFEIDDNTENKCNLNYECSDYFYKISKIRKVTDETLSGWHNGKTHTVLKAYGKIGYKDSKDIMRKYNVVDSYDKTDYETLGITYTNKGLTIKVIEDWHY